MLKGMPFWSRTGLPLAFFAANRRQALPRSEEHTSELQSQSNLVCRLLLEKKKRNLENLRHLIHSVSISHASEALSVRPQRPTPQVNVYHTRPSSGHGCTRARGSGHDCADS